MSRRGDAVYLQDIKEATNKIEIYTKGISYEAFVRSDEKMDAVVRNLEIIGEAAGNISSETRKKYSEIPWKNIVGMRNKVVHEYFGVDIEILWKTIQDDLPALKKSMQKKYG